MAASTVILELWVPVFVAAHIFAGYWLVHALRLLCPQLTLRNLLPTCLGGGGDAQPAGGGDGSEADAGGAAALQGDGKGRLSGAW